MKKKFLIFIFAFVFILTAGICLIACSSDNSNSGGGTADDEDDGMISYIGLEYQDSTYDFSSEEVQIPYRDGLRFEASDFVIVAYHQMNGFMHVPGTSEILKIYDGSEQEATTFGFGDYIIKVSYGGLSLTKSFKISGYDIDVAQISGVEAEYEYKYGTGGYSDAVAIEPEFTLTYKGKTLISGTDYTYCYQNNRFISISGTYAKIVIEGLGEYSGTKTVNFAIKRIKLDEIKIKQAKIESRYQFGDRFYGKYAPINLIIANIPLLSKEYGKDTEVKYNIKQNGVLIYEKVTGAYIYDNDYVTMPGTYEFEYIFNYDERFFSYNYQNPKTTLVIKPIDISDYAVNTITKSYTGYTYTVYDFASKDFNILESNEYTQFYLDLNKDYTIEMMPDGEKLKDGRTVDNKNRSVDRTTVGAVKIKGKGIYDGEIIVTFTIV